MATKNCTNCGRPLDREVSLDAPQWCDDCYERHALAEKITNLREIKPADLWLLSDSLIFAVLRERNYQGVLTKHPAVII
jgi:hypothetical protein